MILTGSDNYPIQIVSLGVIVATIVFIIWQIKLQPRKLNWFLPMLFWISHGLLFYLTLTVERFGLVELSLSYTEWSSILRLHGYLTILAIEVTRWYMHRGTAGK